MILVRQGRVESSTAALIVWYAVASNALSPLPGSMAADSATAGWLVMIGAGLVSLVAVLPGVALLRRFQDLSLPRAADEAGGLLIGKAVTFSVILLLVIVGALGLREFGETFNAEVLFRTPVEIIAVTLALTAGYGSYIGLESFSRLAIFLAPWILLFVVVLVVGSLDQLDLGRLFPLWGYGPADVALDSLLRSSVYAEAVVLFILYPYLRRRARVAAAGLQGLLMSSAVLTVAQLMIVGLLDVTGAERIAFPITDLGRMITVGRFFTRLDPVLVFFWVFVGAVKLSVLLWAAAVALAEALRIPDHRPLVVPLAALVVSGALWPYSLRDTVVFDLEYVRRWAWTVTFGGPLVLWLLALARGKKGAASGAEGGEADEASA